MKRSEINALIKKSEAFIASFQFALPPFCNWSPEDWKTKGHECDEILDNMLGHLSMIFNAKWQNFCIRKILMPALV